MTKSFTKNVFRLNTLEKHYENYYTNPFGPINTGLLAS